MRAMKVVINNCFGGFSLSPEGVLRYAELSGFKVFGYHSDYDDYKKNVRWDGESDPFSMYWLKEDIGDKPTNEQLNAAEWFHERDIKRDDSILVQVVAELGERANGSCAELNIVEIPDGVDYQIEEYDGNEHIAETHRTWS